MSFRDRFGPRLDEDVHVNKRPRHSRAQTSRDLREQSPRYPVPAYGAGRPQPLVQPPALQTPPRSSFTPPQSFSPSSNSSSQRISTPLNDSTWHRPLSPPIQRKLGETSFRYVELDHQASEIRLVRILPETGPTIECELLHTSLENPRSYIAISYTWGDTEETRNIILNGHEFPITESLWGALQRLRSRSFPVIIWADALCINQQNVNERNLQVQSIADIYGKAYSVAVWLGPEADNSHEAIDLMHELLEAEAKEEGMGWLVRDIIGSRRQTPYLQALVNLFHRDYWTRLWVVSEITNAVNITVYCGSSALPWRLYAAASHMCLKYGPELDAAQKETIAEGVSPEPTSTSRWSTALGVYGPGLIRDQGFLKSSTSSLLPALLFYRDRTCTDPRDKVYGILSMLSAYERSEFLVDYSLPVGHVFINVVDHVLSTTRRLDIIRSSIHLLDHNATVKLPSWTPDWSYSPKVRPLGNQALPFSASGETDAKFTILGRRKQLEISAVIVDTIGPTGIELSSQIGIDNAVTAFFAWRLSVIQRSGYNLVAHEAFCRTLSLGQSDQSWSPQEWMEFTYHTFGRLLQQRFPALALDPQLQFYAAQPGPISAEQREKTLHSCIMDSMAARRFCISSTGLLCLGASALRKDDIVVVPLGCSAPIVLRRQGQEYTYVGDIYVDGYMYGMAIEELNSGIRQLQSFTLN
jgi:hypothetical protein